MYQSIQKHTKVVQESIIIVLDISFTFLVLCRDMGRRSIDNFNEYVFDYPSPHRDYWLGFFMADGYVSGTGHISVSLKSTDIAHLEKLKQFLMYTGDIRSYETYLRQTGKTYSQVTLYVHSRYLTQTLSGFNITPQKSLNAEVPESMLYNVHFWRGMIDGDGSLTYNRQRNGKRLPAICLVGTEMVLFQFADFVSAQRIMPPAIHQDFRSNIYQTLLSCDKARKIVQILYNDCTIALDRKLELARRYFGVR